jgi:transglutaminase-like putative cysteine protease
MKCLFADGALQGIHLNMLIRLGYDLIFEIPSPTAMTLLLYVHPDREHDLVEPQRIVVEPEIAVQDYVDVFGNRAARILAPVGRIQLKYSGLIWDAGLYDAQKPTAKQAPVGELPVEVLPFLLSSRYCEVDRLSNIAWDLFGRTEPGWARAKEICNWLEANVEFGYRYARNTKTAWDTYIERTAVCRDFMHLAVAFCRAMNIPARYATGYLGDIGVPESPDPMDFSAFFEVFLDGQWWPMDARHNTPRLGRVLMARGRDATDVALTTSFGPTKLVQFKVLTEEVK